MAGVDEVKLMLPWARQRHAISAARILAAIPGGQRYIEWVTDPQGLKVSTECPRTHPSCFWA